MIIPYSLFMSHPPTTTILPFIVFLLLAFSLPAAAEDACDSLVKNKCLSCHFETRICQKMKKKKGKSSWKRTIKSMIRHGAKLNKGEQKVLVQCFTSRDPSVLSLCGLDK